ncbi:hypothetical protein M5J07_20865 [Achromobacter mucicolens]|uniref:hypothetical protein n=1 Tax=Achromobacter mucicolens TaxID=1389922 RepID=UPI0020A315B7|nr:hypothetical protein [Achromobacter mucicolens]MCP2517404.1 hypothetical protein [Achromobacter mucicolens]
MTLIEHEIVAATVDATCTAVARVVAVSDPRSMNPILGDVAFTVAYFCLMRVLDCHDSANARDRYTLALTSQRKEAAASADAVMAGIQSSRWDLVTGREGFELAYARACVSAAADWARHNTRGVRFDATTGAEVLALAVEGGRRDSAAAEDLGYAVLHKYAPDYADDYTTDSTYF